MNFGRYPIEDQLLAVPMIMRWIRQALGLSQIQMAKMAQVSRQQLNSYENGKALPTHDTWVNWTMAVEKEIRKHTGVRGKRPQELFEESKRGE